MSQHPGDRIVYRTARKAEPSHKPRVQLVRSLTGYSTHAGLVSTLVRYGITITALGLTTALLVPVRDTIGLLNMGLVYLIVVIGATLFAGRRAGIVASVLGFILLNYFLVPPYLTFDVTGHNNLLALFVFLGVSLLISTLISGAREQAEQAQRRAEDVSRLYELSRIITGAQHVDEVLPALAQKVTEVFEVEICWLLLPDERGQLVVGARFPLDARKPWRDEMSEAEWVFRHGKDRGRAGIMDRPFKDQANGGRSASVPLRAAHRITGVLAVTDRRDHRPFTAAERTVLGTFADQAALAMERLYLLKEAQRAELLAHTDELKTALMSAVSHDLRTPLASIMASVTSLMEPEIEWDEETRRDFIQGIYDEARRLNGLVGNLLDMSRIEGGALHPEKDWYSVGEVIEAVVQRLEPRTYDHPVTVQIEEDLPLLLLDFAQIDQVLTNVLENAIKYTPPGTPVMVTAHRVGDNVQVEVADSGPGVPREHLPYLFDKFYRVPSGGSSGGQKGTGLGLAISKGLVEAHGGRIWVSNRQGGGLQISFTLPVEPSPASAGAYNGATMRGQGSL